MGVVKGGAFSLVQLTMDKARKRRFLLLYGSQTGQAEAIAEKIRDTARERGLDPDMYCISQSEKKVVEIEQVERLLLKWLRNQYNT